MSTERGTSPRTDDPRTTAMPLTKGNTPDETSTPSVAALAATSLALAACNANPSTGGSSPSASSGPVAKGGTLTILTARRRSTSTRPRARASRSPPRAGRAPPHHLGHPARTSRPRSVPDLATDTGKASDGGKTWTYTLKDGLKFADGTAITSKDIKYGVERSFAPELSGGLGYHKSLLVGGDDYKGPYDGKELASIETPDDQTIVFHLKSSLRRLAVDRLHAGLHAGPEGQATSPPPTARSRWPAARTRSKSNKQGISLVLERNPSWDAGRRPYRRPGHDRVQDEPGLRPSWRTALISDSGDDTDLVRCDVRAGRPAGPDPAERRRPRTGS